ncbi:MAG: hypothetical protein P4L46_13485 [Fimbriimonas sp.]|nr:hypothetical protein [Fimbriimonas sp.]
MNTPLVSCDPLLANAYMVGSKTAAGSRTITTVPKCLTKRCHQVVQAGWSFCPLCGRDNRPNEFRPTILNCPHKFAGPKCYCVICGDGYGGAKSASGTRANIRFGKLLILIGIVLVVFAVGIKTIGTSGKGPGISLIQAIYNWSIELPGPFVLYGNSLPAYALIAGPVIAMVGIVGIAAANAAKPRPRRKTAPKHAAKPAETQTDEPS